MVSSNSICLFFFFCSLQKGIIIGHFPWQVLRQNTIIYKKEKKKIQRSEYSRLVGVIYIVVSPCPRLITHQLRFTKYCNQRRLCAFYIYIYAAIAGHPTNQRVIGSTSRRPDRGVLFFFFFGRKEEKRTEYTHTHECSILMNSQFIQFLPLRIVSWFDVLCGVWEKVRRTFICQQNIFITYSWVMSVPSDSLYVCVIRGHTMTCTYIVRSSMLFVLHFWLMENESIA